MTKQEAIERIKMATPVAMPFMDMETLLLIQATDIAIECIEKCIEIGSCKECKSADFCYDHPDVCFCLQHDHTMYADDTCNYFYREEWDNE